MRGVLLNPYTGRPVPLDDLDPALVEALPDHILANLGESRMRPWWEQPNMTKQGFIEVLKSDIADGTQILNSTAEALITTDYNFGAEDPHIYPGAHFNCKCYGDMSFVITTPGTVTFRVRWGGLAGVVLAASGAYAPDPTGAVANAPYMLDFDIVWRSIGAAGSAFCMGQLVVNDVDDASATSLKGDLDKALMGSAGALVPAVVGSLDTTTAKALSVTAQFSVNTATTQLTNHIRRLMSLN